MQPDGGSMEPDATPADYYYYLEGAFYYVEPTDDQEYLGGPRQEALPLRSLMFVLAFLRQKLV